MTYGLIEIGWQGGAMTLQYAGIPEVAPEAKEEIGDVMQQFSAECQMMLVWFAGILGSRNAMQRHVQGIAEREEPFTINTYRPDGRVEAVLARVPVEEVIDAVSTAGEFERLYAKAFAVFAYHIWEDDVRRRIAAALKVKKKHVSADLMGEWRHLRNWLVHGAEQDFFDNAPTLIRALSIQRSENWLTAPQVFTLMRLLNHMEVTVTPTSQETAFESIPVNARIIAAAAKRLEARKGMDVPIQAAMLPSPVVIVFSDGPTAMIHEMDCVDKDRQYQSVDGGRWIRTLSRKIAREVIKELGKDEVRCDTCGGD